MDYLNNSTSEAGAVRPLLISVEAAYVALGISRSQLYIMLERGELEAVKIGRRLLVKASSIAGYIDALPIAKVKAGAKIAA